MSDKAIYRFYDRVRMMRKVARQNGIAEALFEEVITSIYAKDEKAVIANIEAFYASLGIEEPALPIKPLEAMPVNKPIREQYFGKHAEEEFQEAVELYPTLQSAHEEALMKWAEYDSAFL